MNTAPPPKRKAARLGRSSHTNVLTKINHTSANGSNGVVSLTTVVAPDGNRVARELTQERIVLGGILNNGLAAIDDTGCDLRAEDFSNPTHGKILCWLRENCTTWQRGIANAQVNHVLLDAAGLVEPLGFGSSAIFELTGAAGDIGEEVLKHFTGLLVADSIRRHEREAVSKCNAGEIDASELSSALLALQQRAAAVEAKTAGLPLAQLLDARRFDCENQPPRPVPLFRIRENAISTAGNITVLAAQAKAGKSALLGGMIAAALNPNASEGDTLGVSSCGAGSKAIIHFDTEQSTFDHDAVVRLALQRAGLTNQPTSLRSYCLTDVSVGERLEMMRFELERACRECGGIFAVFLDGVGDLVRNPNDPDESFAFVGELHRLAIQYDCVFIVVLHENPSAAESAKTRGHLGSHLERKAETNLRLMKTDEVTTVWTDRGARHCNIPKAAGIRFAYSQAERRHCLMESASDARSQAAADELAAFTASVFDGQKDLSWSELRNRIVILASITVGGARKRMEKMTEQGLIRKNLLHKYEFCG